MTATIGQVRGVFNLRDAGDDRTLRTGLLLRGDALARLDDQGREMLGQLGLVTVIDLRSSSEIDRAPNALGNLSVRQVRVDLIGALDSARPPADLAAVYTHLIDERGPALAHVISTLAEPGALPALVHCTAGKDRTGVVVALTQELCGMPEDDIAANYALTAQRLSTEFIAAITAHTPGTALDQQAARALLACPPELILQTLHHLRTNYGSVTNYLLGHGVDRAALDRLRSTLTT